MMTSTSNLNQRLMRAIGQDLPESVAKALKQGASASGEEYDVPLTSALSCLDTTRLRILCMLLDAGADPNGGGILHASPLTTAADKADNRSIELLLQYGADPNVDNGEPLLKSAEMRNVEAVRLLLAKGADPTLGGTFYLKTPLMAVCSTTCDHPGKLQHNPAWSHRYFQIVHGEKSIKRSPSRKKRLEQLYNEYSGAAVSDIIEALVTAGAKIDEVLDDVCALHVAIEDNNLTAQFMLLKRGPNLDIPNGDGVTVREMFEADGEFNLLRLLQSAQIV